MIRTLLCLGAVLALSGCAGIATYDVKPFFDAAAGKEVCCEVVVSNGKDISTVSAHYTKTGDDYTVDLTETGVVASAPISANGATVSAVAGAATSALVDAGKLIK